MCAAPLFHSLARTSLLLPRIVSRCVGRCVDRVAGRLLDLGFPDVRRASDTIRVTPSAYFMVLVLY